MVWLSPFSTMNYIWVFPKIGVPQNGWFIMETLFKWMIWGYPYFWKHPNGGFSSQLCFQRVEKINGFRDGSTPLTPRTAFCGHGVGRLFHGPPDVRECPVGSDAQAERHINYPSNIEWDLTNGCPRKLVNGL